MPINQLIEKLKKGGEAIIEEFRNEVLSVRSNRPQPALIENIRVECPLYGSIMP